MTDEEYYELVERLDQRAEEMERSLLQRMAARVDREIMECDIPPAVREAFRNDG